MAGARLIAAAEKVTCYASMSPKNISDVLGDLQPSPDSVDLVDGKCKIIQNYFYSLEVE